MSMTAAAMNALTGKSGVLVGWIPEMGNGRDCSATATTTTTPRRVGHSHPADNGNTHAGGKAIFCRHPVRIRCLLVQHG